MARSYAKLYQRIWADQAWRALDVDAQHLYTLLISQPTINMAGVLPTQPRRWCSCVAGWKLDQVEDALARLVDARFVVVDWDTEECLVRSLIRNDEAFRTPGMLKAILAAAQDTQSFRLRMALVEELGRLPALEGKTGPEGQALIAATRRILAGDGSPPPGRPGEPVANLSPGTSRGTAPDAICEDASDAMPDGLQDTIPDAIGDGIHGGIPDAIPDTIPDAIGDTSVSVSGSVARSSPVRSTSVLPADAGKAATRNKPTGRTKPTGDELFDQFWVAYPRKTAKPKAMRAWRAAIKQTTPQTIMEGLARFTFKDDPQFVPYPASWLNDERWADEPPIPGARHLMIIAGGDGEPSPTKAQVDEILGDDLWTPPPPPQELFNDLGACQRWESDHRERHHAERVRQALARLGRPARQAVPQ